MYLVRSTTANEWEAGSLPRIIHTSQLHCAENTYIITIA